MKYIVEVSVISPLEWTPGGDAFFRNVDKITPIKEEAPRVEKKKLEQTQNGETQRRAILTFIRNEGGCITSAALKPFAEDIGITGTKRWERLNELEKLGCLVRERDERERIKAIRLTKTGWECGDRLPTHDEVASGAASAVARRIAGGERQ